MIRDFSKMRNMGGRVVITFGYCGDGKGPEYYVGRSSPSQIFTPSRVYMHVPNVNVAETIRAAGQAGLTIIPLAWTLPDGAGETFENAALPRVYAVTQVCVRPLFSRKRN